MNNEIHWTKVGTHKIVLVKAILVISTFTKQKAVWHGGWNGRGNRLKVTIIVWGPTTQKRWRGEISTDFYDSKLSLWATQRIQPTHEGHVSGTRAGVWLIGHAWRTSGCCSQDYCDEKIEEWFFFFWWGQHHHSSTLSIMALSHWN